MSSTPRERVPVLEVAAPQVETASLEAAASTGASLHNTLAPRPPDLLPDTPLIVIEARAVSVGRTLGDLWAYRELLYFLTWRDVKIRYKQTALGAAWAILQPLTTMIIFTLIFGRLAGMKSDGVPYPLFAYAGLLPWMYFANALSAGGNSLVGNANLLTKIYFPRMIIPGAAIAAGLVDFAVALLVLGALMAYYGVAPTWNLLMLPVLIALVSLLALGTGLWMSALNVKYRDIRYALPFLIQIWMFASPVIYPSSEISERWRWVLALNPLTGIIEAFRAALLGHRDFDWLALGISALLTLAVLLYAAHAFRRMERQFADLV